MNRTLALAVTGALAACAHPVPPPPVPPAPLVEAPVHDYRATRSPPIVLRPDSAPFSVIIPDPADSAPLTVNSLARRFGAGAVTMEWERGPVRHVVIFDSTGRVIHRVADTTMTALPVTSMAETPDGSMVFVTGPNRWKMFNRDLRIIATDSTLRLGISADWVGVLDDGSTILHAPTHDASAQWANGTVSVESGSLLRLDKDGRASYLPIMTRDVSAFSQLRLSVSGTSVRVDPGFGLPPNAPWPAQPSRRTLAGDNTIWVFDTMAWRITSYDGSGKPRAVILPPIPPANDSANIDRPVRFNDGITIRTMLDDRGRLWMEPYDTKTRTAPRLMGGRGPRIQATTSPLWGFDSDGTLLGAIEVPAGLKVLQIGSDFLFGLEMRDGNVATVTYRLRAR